MTKFYVIIASIILISCSSENPKDKKTDSFADKVVYDEDNYCDSTLFPDYKYNLMQFDLTALPKYLDDMKVVADSFITVQCAFDSLFCGEIYEKHLKFYVSPDGYELFSIGYAYDDSEPSMELESASFFVFGVRKDGKTIFYDIAEDVVGEIQFQLNGLEVVDDKIVLWGEALPYFATDFGDFKYTFDNGKRNWHYRCKAAH